MSTESAAYWTLWGSRWAFNLTYLRFHPLIVALGTEILDLFDTPLWSLTNGTSEDYNRYDKLADISFYAASLIYLVYFFRCLHWPRGVRWLIALFLGYRIIGNVLSIAMPAVDWIPIAFPNCGGLLLEVYAALDFFRILPLLKHHNAVHVMICLLTIGAKVGQEFYLRWHWTGLGPTQCDTVGHCLSIWLMPTLSFMVIGLWAGYYQWPMWRSGTVGVWHGVFSKADVKHKRKRIKT